MLDTAQCKQAIADWVKLNPTALKPDTDPARIYYVNRPKTAGTNPKDWKRLGKKLLGNSLYRVFYSDATVYLITECVIVIESESGAVTIGAIDFDDCMVKYPEIKISPFQK